MLFQNRHVLQIIQDTFFYSLTVGLSASGQILLEYVGSLSKHGTQITLCLCLTVTKHKVCFSQRQLGISHFCYNLTCQQSHRHARTHTRCQNSFSIFTHLDSPLYLIHHRACSPYLLSSIALFPLCRNHFCNPGTTFILDIRYLTPETTCFFFSADGLVQFSLYTTVYI